MPIHDWSRAHDAAFHDFQLSWLSRLSGCLNNGALPPTYFSLNETIELRPEVSFCELSEPNDAIDAPPGREADAIVVPIPRTTFRFDDDRIQYACRALSIRDDLNQPVAAVFFITRQDKTTPYRRDSLARFAVGALTRGIHLLIVDLFPPNPRNPQGIHKLIWDRIRDEPYVQPADKPFTLASYSAGATIRGFVEPVGVGDALLDMPIFLSPDRYVPCPLEATYQSSWDVFPKPLKGPLLEPTA